MTANATAQKTLSPFYVLGGTLSASASSYITRQADHQLFESLMQGEFCYVLTARQMGKSSLMIRTAIRLREAGVGVAVLDLTATGQPALVEQWYGGLLSQLGQGLDMEDELMEYWQAQPPLLNPLQRWLAAIRAIVLPRYPHRLVIFIDEIDVVRSLPFATDEFFAGIRECYNFRSEDPLMERLTFCLLGVATPSDLIRDTRTTPFNIGHRIELNDFTEQEAAPLASGLKRAAAESSEILSRVLYWTGGHPFLTQRLCKAVADDLPATGKQGVDRLCYDLFFTSRAQERDDNLLFVRERILRNEADVSGLLELYRRIRKGLRKVIDDKANTLIGILHLSGIIRAEAGLLKVRNRIYQRVFDKNWIRDSLPEAEARRQRKAYLRGVILSTTLSSFILALVGWLAYDRSNQAEFNRLLFYDSQMRVALQEVQDANVVRAEDLLKASIPQAGQEDLRNFEWYQLWWQTHREVSRMESKSSIVALASLPESDSLLLGESDRLVAGGNSRYYLKQFNWRENKTSDLFSIPAGPNFSLIVFSPDKRQVVTNSANPQNNKDYRAVLFDRASGRQLSVFSGHNSPISVTAFSPDGQKLATGDMGGVIKLWDFKTGREQKPFSKLTNLQSATSERTIASVSFSPNGRFIAVTVKGNHLVWLLESITGQIAQKIDIGRGEPTATFFPDGKKLLVATASGVLKVWDISQETVKDMPVGHKGQVQTIAFSPDGRTVATGGTDREVMLHSAETTYGYLTTFKGHGSTVSALAWSPDSNYLGTGSGDGVVKIWDIKAQPYPNLPLERVNSYLATTFSEQGDLIAFGVSDSKKGNIWNLASGKSLIELESIGDGELMCAIFSSDGKFLATGGSDRMVRLWDGTTGRLVRALAGHTKQVYTLNFSLDNKLLLSGSGDQTLRLWSVETWKELASFQGGVPNLWSTAFSPDGQLLASASTDGSVNLWDVQTRRLIRTFPGQASRVTAISFSPDGQLLATGSRNEVKIWDVNTGRMSKDLGQASNVQRVVFSPDGKRLVTGSDIGEIKLWDLKTGYKFIELKPHQDEVTSITFSRDGLNLVTSGKDGTIQWLPAASPEEVRRQLNHN